MALATRCPHCNALFRVAPEQLTSRGGMVRCGACRGIFNAIAGLDYLSAAQFAGHAAGPAAESAAVSGDAAAALPAASVPAAPAAPASAVPAAPPPQTRVAGAEVLEGPATASVAPPARSVAGAAPAAVPEPAAASALPPPAASVAELPPPPPPAPPSAAPAAREPAQEEPDVSGNTLTVFSLPDLETRPGPALAAGAAGETSALDPMAAEEPAGSEAAPSFLLAPKASPARRVAQGASGVALALLLAVQLTLIYRTRVLVQWPALRPALEALCAPLGCTVAWPMRPDLLAVVSSELQSLPGTNVLEFNAVLRSRAGYPLELPAVELTLTDSLNRAVARRVFLPTDYRAALPESGAPLAGAIPAGSDLSVRLLFETPDGGAAGFEAYPFYP